MFGALARFILRHRRAIVIVYASLLPLAVVAGHDVINHLKPGGFEDPDRESWQVYGLIQREMRAGTGDILALYTMTTPGTVEDLEVMGELLAVVTRVETDAAVTNVDSYWSTAAPHFLSRDKTRTFISIDLQGDDAAKVQAFHRLAPHLKAEGLTLQVGGYVPTNVTIFDTIQKDLTRAELLAFPLTALIVLMVFGSMGSVSVLLAAGLSAIIFAFAMLRGIAAVTDVSVLAVNTVTILGLGLSVDYSLFIVNRFREELPERGVNDALIRTMSTTGRAVAFSGITVAASLCGLFAFKQVMLRSLAIGGVVVVLGTAFLSLTLVPALLAVLGPRVDALRVPMPSILKISGAAVGPHNPWYRVATLIMRRPVIVAVIVTVGLLSLALPYQRFIGTIIDERVLPPTTPVCETHRVLREEFMANQSTPTVVLATVEGDPRSRENLERLAALSDRLATIPGVSRVDGVFSFIPGVSSAKVIEALLDPNRKVDPQEEAQLGRFIHGPHMRFQILSKRPFDDEENLEAVRTLRTWSEPGLQVRVAGYSAALVDLRQALSERGAVAVVGVIIAMFFILFVVFGSVTLPIKAVIMNALSLTASFGAIVWIFQEGRFTSLLDYTPLGASDASQPLVMFAIVFGLSMDYEVLILARIREEYMKSGDNSQAIAVGLARTGRLITSAAALLVVVVGAFATSNVLFMKTLGVGMALAIAIDATIVRGMLVPAAMHLMGRWNWWAPAPLLRLWKKTGMADVEE